MTKPPAERKTIVRWTMVLHRAKRRVDLQRCAEEVCHALHDAHFANPPKVMVCMIYFGCLKSVYLIATRDLSNLWLQFFYLKIKGLCDFLRKRF